MIARIVLEREKARGKRSCVTSSVTANRSRRLTLRPCALAICAHRSLACSRTTVAGKSFSSRLRRTIQYGPATCTSAEAASSSAGTHPKLLA